jgi:hypothetical protein
MLINGKAKVLMLHGKSSKHTEIKYHTNVGFSLGHAESGPSFHARTKRLETHLHNTFPAAPHRKHHPLFPGGIELHYPTGPVKLTPGEASRSDGPKKEFRSHSPSDPFRSPLRERAESDAYAWGMGDLRKTEDVEGLNNSITFALEYIQANGPFVGVVGFSSGATLAVILTSLLEHPKSVKGFEYPPNVSFLSRVHKAHKLMYCSSTIHHFTSPYAIPVSNSLHRHTNHFTILRSRRLHFM